MSVARQLSNLPSMIRYPILCSIWLTAAASLAQSVYGIEFDSIRIWTEQDKPYFEALHKQSTNVQMAMDPSEVMLAYYSTAYLDGYAPYSILFENLTEETLADTGKTKDYINTNARLTNRYPVCMRAYLNLGVAYSAIGDTANARLYLARFYDLLNVVYHSGTGESIDSAIVVHSIDDEYIVLQQMGCQFISQSLIRENGIPYDKMVVKCTDAEGNSEDKIFYFNIYQPMVLGLATMFDEDKPKKKKKKANRS
jgi:hypothetical protein